MTELEFTPEQHERINAEDAAAARADAADRVKIQATIADAMMKALMLANGGAMVALFTFIGNLLAKQGHPVPFDKRDLWIAFVCFVTGLVASLLCHFAAFLSQDRFYNSAMREAWRRQSASVRQVATSPTPDEFLMYRQGTLAYFAGLLLALLATAAFAAGCGFALAGVLV